MFYQVKPEHTVVASMDPRVLEGLRTIYGRCAFHKISQRFKIKILQNNSFFFFAFSFFYWIVQFSIQTVCLTAEHWRGSGTWIPLRRLLQDGCSLGWNVNIFRPCSVAAAATATTTTTTTTTTHPRPEAAQSIPDYSFYSLNTLYWLVRPDLCSLVAPCCNSGNKVTPTRPSVVTAFQITDTDTLLLI